MKKKFISFVLAMVFLFSLGDFTAEAKSFTKGIDVLTNNFRLQLESNYITHKDAFIYEGELFVPLGDLAKGLKLKQSLSINNRSIYLVSSNRLSFSDESGFALSYQRGYEATALNKMISNINSLIKGTVNNKANKQNLESKYITASFSGINIFLDGKRLLLDVEPFIYQNDIYVSLNSISPYFYLTAELKDNVVHIDANGILLDKEKSNFYYPIYYPMSELLAQRELITTKYYRELELLNKKKQVLLDLNLPYEEITSLSSMEKYLDRYFSEIGDLSLDIDLTSSSGNWVYVDIDFSSRSNYLWNELSKRDVEAHIWNIYSSITSLYNENAKLQGNIKKLVTFNTKGNTLEFNFINSNLDLTEKVDPIIIEDLLNSELNRYRSERFSYSARLSGYDLEIVIEPRDDDFFGWSPNIKMDFIQNINDLIEEYYVDLNIMGKVMYDEDEISFVVENGKIRSSDILNETSEYLSDEYDSLYSQGKSIPMKYSFVEVNLNTFKLLVDMDFDSSESIWNIQTKDDLGLQLHEIMQLIIDTWDTNIVVEVYDKNQAPLAEYVISQDTVQIVRSNPSGGEIYEGSTIELSTFTVGADIYYTTDGTIPDMTSNLYTGPITIGSDTTIRAIGTLENFKNSPVSTFVFTTKPLDTLSSGLSNLTFNIGTLSPVFSSKELNYNLEVLNNETKLTIKPTASSGAISINDIVVASGTDFTIDLPTDKITITHKEANRLPVTYTINIKAVEPAPEVEIIKLETYSFKLNKDTNTIDFSGSLSGSSTGYAGYKIKLMSTTGAPYINEIIVNETDGSFSLSGIPATEENITIGYQYSILSGDADNPLISEPIVLVLDEEVID